MKVKRDWTPSRYSEYKKYKNLYPNNKVSYKKYVKIINRYNELITDYVLETGNIVMLPKGFGKIGIIKKKIRPIKIDNYIFGLPVSWKKSKEKKKFVYAMNHHSDGYYFRWMLKLGVNVTMKKYWKLTSCRRIKDLLKKKILSDPGFKDIILLKMR